MGLFSRDRSDTRSAREVADDISHDIYHRAAKLDRGSADAKKNWRHLEDCEYTRKRDHDQRNGS